MGGIFTGYLMGYRSDTLASIVAWSTGETDPAGRHVVPGPLDETLRDMWSFMLAHPFTPGNGAARAATGIAGRLPPYCRVVS